MNFYSQSHFFFWNSKEITKINFDEIVFLHNYSVVFFYALIEKYKTHIFIVLPLSNSPEIPEMDKHVIIGSSILVDEFLLVKNSN